MHFNNNLSVVGNTNIAGTLSVANAAFLNCPLSVTGNTELDGTLSVTGNVFLKSDLSVGGKTDLVGTLSVNSKVYLKDSLSIGGNTDLVGTLSVGSDVTLNSNLSVVKNAYFGGPIMKIPAGVEINRPASNVAPAGSIYFNTDTYRFEGLHDLGPNGKEWKPFGGVMDIDADTYITAEKTPDNDTISFYADNADVPRMTMTSGLLSVALPTNIANTLSVQGATTLSSTLSVTAATTLSSTLSVADAVFMSNTLSVTNVASFDNTVKIFGKLSVTDKAILADTLSVGKEVYMSSNLSVIGAMELGGTGRDRCYHLKLLSRSVTPRCVLSFRHCDATHSRSLRCGQHLSLASFLSTTPISSRPPSLWPTANSNTACSVVARQGARH